MKHKYHYITPIGTVCIVEDEGYISALYIDEVSSDIDDTETELIRQTYIQLSEYFDGKRYEFDIPINPQGTEFQQKVWEALRTIPYGETRSYGEIAEQIGNPKACRAVGGANNKNPILIITPCHRVIGADGTLVGFGAGLDVKRTLIDLERR